MVHADGDSAPSRPLRRAKTEREEQSQNGPASRRHSRGVGTCGTNPKRPTFTRRRKWWGTATVETKPQVPSFTPPVSRAQTCGSKPRRRRMSSSLSRSRQLDRSSRIFDEQLPTSIVAQAELLAEVVVGLLH